jgi:hypothetical protein
MHALYARGRLKRACMRVDTRRDMLHPHLQRILVALATVAVGIGAYLAATHLQREVRVVPGMRGCVRLEGATRQQHCIAQVTRDRVEAATRGKHGVDRQLAVAATIARLDDEVAELPTIASNCHPAMHTIGRHEGRAAAKAGTVPVFPADPERLCTAGYVHGLAEGYLEAAPTADIGTVFPSLCAVKASRDGCAHGLGHGLLRNDPQADALAAAERCRELPAAEFASCTSGVMMQHAMASSTGFDEYVDTCLASAGTVRFSCYGYVGLVAARLDLSSAEVQRVCQTAPGDGAESCAQAFGRDLGVAKLGGCGRFSTDATQRACIAGAVALQVASDHVTAAAADASCRRELSTAALQDYCVDQVAKASRPATS